MIIVRRHFLQQQTSELLDELGPSEEVEDSSAETEVSTVPFDWLGFFSEGCSFFVAHDIFITTRKVDFLTLVGLKTLQFSPKFSN